MPGCFSQITAQVQKHGVLMVGLTREQYNKVQQQYSSSRERCSSVFRLDVHQRVPRMKWPNAQQHQARSCNSRCPKVCSKCRYPETEGRRFSGVPEGIYHLLTGDFHWTAFPTHIFLRSNHVSVLALQRHLLSTSRNTKARAHSLLRSCRPRLRACLSRKSNSLLCLMTVFEPRGRRTKLGRTHRGQPDMVLRRAGAGDVSG